MATAYARIYPRSDFRFDAVFEPSFNSFIKDARERKGMSIRKLAENLKCTHPYLILIESGERKPAPRLLSQLQKELDLEPFFLVPQKDLLTHLGRPLNRPGLEYETRSLSHLMGLLYTLLREEGVVAELRFPEKEERALDIIVCFDLGPGETYEIAIKRKGKSGEQSETQEVTPKPPRI
jgi:transcriptional regulator with XRE-family HTH domain